MKAHARAPIPEGLTESQMNSFVAERNELVATAEAAMKLANGIERRGQKARGRTLTRADMESLGREADPLNRRIHQKIARNSMHKSPNRVDLNVSRRDVEPAREPVAVYSQTATIYLQNYNQKTSQYLNMLSSVLKTMNEVSASIVRNMR
jgi:hypothetical protein